jgi:hypothetical protein
MQPMLGGQVKDGQQSTLVLSDAHASGVLPTRCVRRAPTSCKSEFVAHGTVVEELAEIGTLRSRNPSSDTTGRMSLEIAHASIRNYRLDR